MEIFINILLSIPILLVTLYFIPFLGVVLVLFRYFKERNKNQYVTAFIFLALGLLCFIPAIIDSFWKNSYIKAIVSHKIYSSFISYGKHLIILGVLSIIIIYALNRLGIILGNKTRELIEKEESIERESKDKAQKEIAEKQMKAKNTHVVYCPHCGSDNMLVGNVGTCKYCRRKIVYKGE